jgi:hypothetical protein
VYLEDCRISDAVAPYALDEERARRLWDLSANLCDYIAPDCIRA